jgi:hypothetical protein
MLDAKATITLTVFLCDPFEDSQDLIIGTIADGVNHHVQTGAVGIAHAAKHRTLRKHLIASQPARLRRVIVGFIEKRRRGTQTSVSETFQAANTQHVAAKVRAHSSFCQTFPRRQG